MQALSDPADDWNPPASPDELRRYRRVFGQMMYVGRCSQPVLLFHASLMASKTGNPARHALKDLKALLEFDFQTSPLLSYTQPTTCEPFLIDRYCDEALGTKKETAGRSGLGIFQRREDPVHPLHLNSKKLCLVPRSSATAEILAASETCNIHRYILHLLDEFGVPTQEELNTDTR